MIRKLSLTALVCATLIGQGCSSIGKATDSVTGLFRGYSNADPPKELQDLEQPMAVNELWSDDLGDGMDDQTVSLYPSLRDGVLYAAAREGEVGAFDSTSGRNLWVTDLDLPLSGGPGVGDDVVVVGTIDAEVVALNQVDGSERWRAHVNSEILSVPAVDYGVVVIRSVDGKITGLDSSTGETLWVYIRDVPVLSLRGSASPVIAGQQVINGLANGKLVSLDLQNGNLLWEATVAQPSGRSDLERMVDIDSAPVVTDGNVYAVTFQGEMASVTEESGFVLWRRELSSYAGLAGDWRRIYVVDSDDNVWALDASNGASIWKQEDLYHRGLSRPTIVGDYLAVGDYEGYVHFIDPDNGRIVARTRVDSKGISAPMMVDEDNVLYVYGNSGELAALKLDSEY